MLILRALVVEAAFFSPTSYEDRQNVVVEVGKVTSTKTQIPYDASALPSCFYMSVQMKVPEACRVLCKRDHNRNEMKLFRLMIDNAYRVSLAIDGLPAIEPRSVSSLIVWCWPAWRSLCVWLSCWPAWHVALPVCAAHGLTLLLARVALPCVLPMGRLLRWPAWRVTPPVCAALGAARVCATNGLALVLVSLIFGCSRVGKLPVCAVRVPHGLRRR